MWLFKLYKKLFPKKASPRAILMCMEWLERLCYPGFKEMLRITINEFGKEDKELKTHLTTDYDQEFIFRDSATMEAEMQAAIDAIIKNYFKDVTFKWVEPLVVESCHAGFDVTLKWGEPLVVESCHTSFKDFDSTYAGYRVKFKIMI